MTWVTLMLAIYGAALSSVLAYLAWRKDRHSLRFFVSYRRRSDWYGVSISVVNVGFRPVILQDIHFVQSDGGLYLNELDENLGLPRRIDEGEQLEVSFHAEDIEPGTTAFVIRDTHRREHRMKFTPDVWQGVTSFREFVEETSPELYHEGKKRLAPSMRRGFRDPDA